MTYRGSWIPVIAVILGLVIFIPVAQAQRQNYETIFCGSVTYNVVQFSKEASIMSGDMKGIAGSTHESKLFDNWTAHAVFSLKGLDGKWTWNGFIKNMGPDGDFILSEFYGDSESGTVTGKMFYGTGKWKGVKGEVKTTRITTGKPIVQGTEQFCEKRVGWIELPK